MSDKATPHINIHDALLLDGSPESILEHYSKWAKTYDTDVIDNYFGVELICKLMHQHLQANSPSNSVDPSCVKLVDVGCGTGLLGTPLHNLGYNKLDGIDLSKEMIEKARDTNHYTGLFAEINIHDELPGHLRHAYDVSICLGVFTPGHVKPEALYQLAGLCKPGGLIVASTRIPYYDSTEFQAVSDALETRGIVKLKQRCMDAPYRDDGNAHYWVYEVL